MSPTQIEAIDRLIARVSTGTARNGHFDDVFDISPTGNNAIGAYNGDLNDAKALHEALLPGWEWDIFSKGMAEVWQLPEPEQAISGRDSDPARAWLLAILRAHRHQIAAGGE